MSGRPRTAWNRISYSEQIKKKMRVSSYKEVKELAMDRDK